MIKSFNTNIALITVGGTGRAVDEALVAKFESEVMGFVGGDVYFADVAHKL